MEHLELILGIATVALLGLLLFVVLRAVGKVNRIEGELRRLAAKLEEPRPDLLTPVSRVEEQLAGLGEKLDMLDHRNRLQEIEEALKAASSREFPVVRVAEEVEPLIKEAVESLDARLRELAASLKEDRRETRTELLTRVLNDRGFRDVTVVEVTEEEGGRARVSVEARRDGMTFKGPVTIENGRVVEQKLTPSYPMFP
jgi:vacuolar-type H+-ATPase subunit I/STV1